MSELRNSQKMLNTYFFIVHFQYHLLVLLAYHCNRISQLLKITLLVDKLCIPSINHNMSHLTLPKFLFFYSCICMTDSMFVTLVFNPTTLTFSHCFSVLVYHRLTVCVESKFIIVSLSCECLRLSPS